MDHTLKIMELASYTATVLGIPIGIAVFLHSVRTFNKSVLLSHYGVLDDMYADLLKLAIEKPHLRTPSATRTTEQQQEYEYYAHLAWCFVENVYDRSMLDKGILHSWFSAVEIETRLHRDWLDRPENSYMFKDEFHKYIAKTFPRSKASTTTTESRQRTTP